MMQVRKDVIFAKAKEITRGFPIQQ